MTDRELMQIALDALETGLTINDQDSLRWTKTIEALRARLAQPAQQEPTDKTGSLCTEFWGWLPKAYRDGDKGDERKFTKYNMEVAYLAGKQSQPEQEPVAWRYALDASVEEPRWIYIDKDPHQWLKESAMANALIEPLYTAPPQREWQGLTEQEMFSLWMKCPAETEDRFAFAHAIQAKLKEKNS